MATNRFFAFAHDPAVRTCPGQERVDQFLVIEQLDLLGFTQPIDVHTFDKRRSHTGQGCINRAPVLFAEFRIRVSGKIIADPLCLERERGSDIDDPALRFIGKSNSGDDWKQRTQQYDQRSGLHNDPRQIRWIPIFQPAPMVTTVHRQENAQSRSYGIKKNKALTNSPGPENPDHRTH